MKKQIAVSNQFIHSDYCGNKITAVYLWDKAQKVQGGNKTQACKKRFYTPAKDMPMWHPSKYNTNLNALKNMSFTTPSNDFIKAFDLFKYKKGMSTFKFSSNFVDCIFVDKDKPNSYTLFNMSDLIDVSTTNMDLLNFFMVVISFNQVGAKSFYVPLERFRNTWGKTKGKVSLYQYTMSKNKFCLDNLERHTGIKMGYEYIKDENKVVTGVDYTILHIPKKYRVNSSINGSRLSDNRRDHANKTLASASQAVASLYKSIGNALTQRSNVNGLQVSLENMYTGLKKKGFGDVSKQEFLTILFTEFKTTSILGLQGQAFSPDMEIQGDSLKIPLTKLSQDILKGIALKSVTYDNTSRLNSTKEQNLYDYLDTLPIGPVQVLSKEKICKILGVAVNSFDPESLRGMFKDIQSKCSYYFTDMKVISTGLAFRKAMHIARAYTRGLWKETQHASNMVTHIKKQLVSWGINLHRKLMKVIDTSLECALKVYLALGHLWKERESFYNWRGFASSLITSGNYIEYVSANIDSDDIFEIEYQRI